MIENSNICAFTVCNYAYLNRALVLAKSLFEKDQLKLKIVLIDEIKEQHSFEFCEIIPIKEFKIIDWKKLAFQYDIIEFSTAVKPALANYFMEYSQYVLFLDPDIYVADSVVTPLNEFLAEKSIYLTPHHLTPQPSTPNESDLPMMRFGSFNLGFFFLRRSDQSRSFLAWWGQRCRDFCFMESQFGLSTDQKWISIAPCFFDELKIIRHPGFNVAAWNTFERQIEKSTDGFLINGEKLIFFHFSNFDEADPGYLKKRASNEVGKVYEDLVALSETYISLMQSLPIYRYNYAYDYDEFGNYISPTYRRAYYSIRDILEDEDPFCSKNLIEFAKSNGLIQKNNKKYKLIGFRTLSKKPTSLKIFDALFKLVLHIFGPNRFFDFNRLLVNRTLLWKNTDMWNTRAIRKGRKSG